MNDKDFDEIGKRLQNMDADPPKDGWNRIATTLNAPRRPGRVVWLKKNWWKPLLFLIPISFYLVYSEQGVMNLELSSSLSGDSAGRHPVGEKIEAPRSIDSKRSGQAQKSQEPVGHSKSGSGSRSETKTKLLADKSKQAQGSTPQSPLVLEDTGKGQAEGQVAKSGTIVSVSSANEATSKDSGLSIEKRKPVSSNQEINMQGNTALLENGVTPEEKRNPATNDASGEGENIVSAKTGIAINGQSTADSQSQGALNSSVDSSGTLAATQTTAIERDAAGRETDIASSTENFKEDTSKQRHWRITALAAPQFSTKGPKPVANDDVLVTEIQGSGDPEVIGFGIAVGAGIAITPQFYIDGQVSFMETKLDTYSSTATGNVDTLIAVQQPDQSVRVTPVYQVNSREISSEYRYAGITVGGTYYFWSTPRRRFNVTANAGAHYLVDATLREKIDGQWWTLSTENMNKMNYTVMIAAGYNIKMSQGWELMINPSLMYYLKETLSGELPYSLNQGVFGLNIMLSKTLGRVK